MLTQFRTHYPHGSLISELITIDRGQYIVKVTIQIEGVILSTGLAAAERIETAEDNARERALLTLALDSHPQISTLPDSGVTVVNQTETIKKKSSDLVARHQSQPVKNSNLVNLSFNPDSASSNQLPSREQEADKIEPIQVNKSMVSGSQKREEAQPEVVDNLVESSASPKLTNYAASTNFSELEPTSPKQEYTPIDSPPHDLPLSSPPQSSEELSSELNEPQLDVVQPEIPVTQTVGIETVEFDFNEIKNRTDVEIKRLGWTKDQGRDFLLQTYGKRSRLHLTDQELMDFLHYLESQPNP